MEKTEVEEFEKIQSQVRPHLPHTMYPQVLCIRHQSAGAIENAIQEDGTTEAADGSNGDVYGEKLNQRLNWRIDVRVIPLCCWLYLLNFLDRGNIGNARVLNT
jgi:hypothetical protein